MTYTFTLSDESLNSYGFVVKTDSIDLSRFLKNPIMLYMHERRDGVIGRWENVRKVDNKLLADAIFDVADTLGLQIKNKVDKGFLRSASIGIETIDLVDIDGVKTTTKCVLKEVSIVDIPSNENAVKLFKKNGTLAYNLADLDDEVDEEYDVEKFFDTLLSLLELDRNATPDEIISRIKEIKQLSSNTELDKALKLGFIDDKEHSFLLQMNDSKPFEVTNYLKDKTSDSENSISKEVAKANRDGKIIFYDKQLYEELGAEIGLKSLKKLFKTIPTQLRVTDFMDKGKDNNQATWGLNEYRKYAPKQLKDNPQLYHDLIAQEDEKNAIGLGLDYYRKNNPEYLRDNPQEYQRLLEQNKRK